MLSAAENQVKCLRVSTEQGAVMSEESVRITKGRKACFHMLSPSNLRLLKKYLIKNGNDNISVLEQARSTAIGLMKH